MSDDESADDGTRPGGSGATDLSPPEERGIPPLAEEAEDSDTDGDLFEEMDVEGDPEDASAWEALTEGEVETESPADIDGEARTISDRTCHGCRFFADPPETACMHPGTEINRVVDTDHFEVVDCPMVVAAIDVATDETDETNDGRLDSPGTADVDGAEIGAIDSGSTDANDDAIDDTDELIDIRDTTADDTAGNATVAEAPEQIDGERKPGTEPAAHGEPDSTVSGSEDGDDGSVDRADATRNGVDESGAERDTVGAEDTGESDAELTPDDDELDDDLDGAEDDIARNRDRDDTATAHDTDDDTSNDPDESVDPDEITWGDGDDDSADEDDADEDTDLSIDWANDDE